MATIPSWLNQPDFLGAIRSGAGLGLQRREAQDRASLATESLLQNREAGINRLQLAYDQLAAEQDWRNEAIHARQEEAAARLGEQLRAANALEKHREAIERNAVTRLGLTAEHNSALENLRQQSQDLASDKFLMELEEEPGPTRLDLEPGDYRTRGGGHFYVPDRSKVSLGAENALRSRIASDSAVLAKSDATPEQKAFAADDLKRAQTALGISLMPEVTQQVTPGEKRSLLGLDFLAKDVPATTNSTTNLVVKSLAQPPPQEGTAKAVKAFDDEAAARSEGYGAGDIIILRGVGKVRLK